MDDRLLRVRECCSRVGISVREWWRKVSAGEVPQPVYVGPRSPRWPESEVTAYIERLMQERV